MKRIVERLDRFQRRHKVLAVTVAVFKRFGEHNGGRLAAVISYYGFFSVFPLLLVLVTILGLVLEDNPELRTELVEGALGQIPVVGSQLADAQQPLEGNVIALVVGLATALWAGLGAVGALQQAMDELWDIPVHARASFVFKRLRSVAALAVLAGGIVATTLLSNLATLFDVSVVGGAFGLVGTAVVDAVLLGAAFQLLTSRHLTRREIVPGAIAGGVALLLLHQAGSFVVRRFLAGADDTYGTFAAVIALLSWFFLVGRAVLLAVELNVVLASELHPRSLSKEVPLTDADRRAMLLDVERVQRDVRIGYATAVGDDAIAADGEPGRAARRRRTGRRSARDVEVTGETADLEQSLHGRTR